MNLKVKIYLVFMVFVLVWAACRKIDSAASGEEASIDKEAKFFTNHLPTDPAVKAALGFVKGQNDKYHFVRKLTSQIGYPLWDKSQVFRNVPLESGRGESIGSADVVYVPFVIDSQNHVNTTLMLKMDPADTTFRFVSDWQYKNFSFDSVNTTPNEWTAKDIFHIFAVMNRAAFGDTQFMVTDGRIFADSQHRQRLVTLRPQLTSGRFTENYSVTFCNVISSCVYVGPSSNRTSLTESDPGSSSGPCYCSCSYNLQCTTVWITGGGGSSSGGGGGSSSGGGGGGGGNTGGNGSGSGGGGGTGNGGNGWDYTNCDPTNQNIECGTGWYTYNGDPNGNNTTEPIDTLLKKAAEVVNKYRDSLSQLCEAEHKERFFNIVYYNNQLDTFRVLTSQTDNEVKPNYNMTGGRLLKAEWHYHPKYSDGTPGSWPSGGDIANLYTKPTGHVMIIDTENARYALVVEDATKMNTWKNIFGNGHTIIPYRVQELVVSDPRIYGTSDSYIQMTKEKVLEVLGNSSTCGIGLYQATSANGTSFIKIN